MSRKTIQQIQDKKNHHQKITVLTAYDYQIASLLDAAGIDIILVGDSLANVVLGLDSTTEVGMDEMLHHAKAVSRSVRKSLLVADLPYAASRTTPDQAALLAKKLIDAGCDAVKVEWFDRCLETISAIIKAGIPVMGHVGLTPQNIEALGGYKVQGRDFETAEQILEQCKDLQLNGCFSVVLECIPEEVGKIITKNLHMPTISCGGGVFCDGQVLVTNDMLGLTSQHNPRFVKKYLDLSGQILEGVIQYAKEVAEGVFPGEEQSYYMHEEDRNRFLEKYSPEDLTKSEEEV